jgi:hypothetical protein
LLYQGLRQFQSRGGTIISEYATVTHGQGAIKLIGHWQELAFDDLPSNPMGAQIGA